MGSPPSAHRAHRCSFPPDRRDPYLRLSTVTVFVRDQDRSLRFYLDQLGFCLAFDARFPPGDRWLTVTPPDGTAMLALVAPDPDSDEYKLIGRATQIAFLTEDILAKFEEWRKRGVRFHHEPQERSWGAMSTTFEDVDGNSFTLLAFEEMTREVEAQRRAHADRWESERRAALELEMAKQTQARLLPQMPPPLKTLDCKGVCLQARQAGGDYYHLLDLRPRRLRVWDWGVSGKGNPGALLIGQFQGHLRKPVGTK